MSWHLSLIPRHVGGVGAAEAQSFPTRQAAGDDMWTRRDRLLNLTLVVEVAVAEYSPCTGCFRLARQSSAKPPKLSRAVKDSPDAKKEIGKVPTASRRPRFQIQIRLCILCLDVPGSYGLFKRSVHSAEYLLQAKR